MTTERATESRRERLLEVLREDATALGATELAERLTWPANTVRFHLDALERDGQIERAGTVAGARGRPRVVYRAVPPGHDEQDFLVRMLATSAGRSIASRRAARAASFAWGKSTAEGRPTAHPRAGLAHLLQDTGFAPISTRPDVIDLHRCPFADLIAEHRDVICAVHAGVIDGALDGWGAADPAVVLDPLVEPGVCRVHWPENDRRENVA